MKKFKVIPFIFFASFLSCTEKQDQSATKSTSSSVDSVKVFYENFQKNRLDSLNLNITKEIFTSKGINMEKFLKAELKTDSLSYEYYAQYSYWLHFNHRNSEALEYLNRGSKFVKDKSRYYFDKACAWSYIQPIGKRDSVRYYMTLAIKNDSLNGFYYAARSQFNNEDENNSSLIEDINKAIFLDPNEISYVNQRGMYKIIFSDYEGALSDLKNISPLNQRNPQFYLCRAIAYHKLKKRKKAFEAADMCIELNPNFAMAYAIRGNSRYMLGEEDAGISDLRKAAELGDKEASEFIFRYNEYKKTHKKS